MSETTASRDPDLRPTAELLELQRLIGVEESLGYLHRALERAIHSIRPVEEYGASLISCSDEQMGEFRVGFERDLAGSISSPLGGGFRFTFSTTNIGGRVESGAVPIADDHFSVRSRAVGAKLHVLEVAAHVGRRQGADGVLYGEHGRLGRPSPCCGALAAAVGDLGGNEARTPSWLEELRGTLGERRLAGLREGDPGWRPVSAAISHSVLQAERLVGEILGYDPVAPTHYLIVPLVVINQEGPNGVVLTGIHHLYCAQERAWFVHGAALCTTPGSHRFREEADRLRVDCALELDREGEARGSEPPEPEVASEEAAIERPPAEPAVPVPELPPDQVAEIVETVSSSLDENQREELRARTRELRENLHHSRRGTFHARVFARPILRALSQSLTVIAPELGLAALLFQGGRSIHRAHRVHKLLESGPSSEEARRVLREIEAEVQHLPHAEAEQVLDVLLAEKGPLLGALV